MIKQLLAVVVVFAFFFTPAGADGPRLNLSHACELPGGEMELHFVLVQAPPADYAGTHVDYDLLIAGVPVTGVAQFTRTSGGVVHYDAITPTAAPVIVAIAATLEVGNVRYKLANAGVFDVPACVPTGIPVEDFYVFLPFVLR